MVTPSHQSGFGNEFATEAIPGVLPKGQNSPQKVAHGLCAEQFSGTSFTMSRGTNRRAWLYRIRPSAMHGEFRLIEQTKICSAPITHTHSVSPDQMRWHCLPIPAGRTDFIDGLVSMAGNGDVRTQTGVAIHMYAANASMQDRFFYNADGEMLIVPQFGDLSFMTEMGILKVSPGEIIVIPRGMRFRVELMGEARGYVCENYGALFRLPELGPIGANGLANSRDFLSPTASYEDKEGDFRLVAKFQGQLWEAPIAHSPLDVVAWHGNYAPYKYDLKNFNVINSVSFDHCDPSIFTVLSSPSEIAGTANVDFVIFPPRWVVSEHTFRPPYFHRNVMSEFMGLIHGVYDAKAKGFVPGGASLHNCMSGHGPDAETFEAASNADLKPVYQDSTMAFMFETRFVNWPTQFALNAPHRDREYQKCWQGLQKKFKASR